MKHISSIVALSISSILLSACGGGSSGTSTGVAPGVTVNALAGMKGTYVLACEGHAFTDGSGQGNNMSESQQGTITVTPDSSSNGAIVTLHTLYYAGSLNCASATLDTDLTVTGQLSGKGTTKNFKDASGKNVTAQVGTFTYTGLTLSKGNLTGSLPTFGATATVAYLVTGNNLYVSKGHRGTDGIGGTLSTEVAVKQ